MATQDDEKEQLWVAFEAAAKKCSTDHPDWRDSINDWQFFEYVIAEITASDFRRKTH